MARMTRVVVAFYPHHVTQRGNRRQQIFLAMVITQPVLSPCRNSVARQGPGYERIARCPTACTW